MRKGAYLTKATGMGFILLMVSAVMLQIPGTAEAQEEEDVLESKGKGETENHLELPRIPYASITIAVRDLDKAIENYGSCGMGPFEPELPTRDPTAFPEYKVYGKTPADRGKARSRHNTASPINVEFFQPLEGKSIVEEYLEKHGDGVQHISYFVDDIEKETAKLVAKGFPVVISATTKSGSRFRWIDTRKFGNFMLELMQLSEKPGKEDPITQDELKIDRKKRGMIGDAWELHHLGIGVRDLDKAVEYYESWLGPCEPEYTVDTSAYPEYRVYGKTPASPYRAKARLNTATPIMLHLFEPLEGGHIHIHEEFLGRHGAGVQHIGYLVDDLEKETAKLVAKEFPVVVSATTESGSRYAMFDIRTFGSNFCLKLIQRSEE